MNNVAFPVIDGSHSADSNQRVEYLRQALFPRAAALEARSDGVLVERYSRLRQCLRDEAHLLRQCDSVV